MQFKKSQDKERAIEIEFGFRYYKKDLQPRIGLFAKEVNRLRAQNRILVEQRKEDIERVRMLELQISELDFKLRG